MRGLGVSVAPVPLQWPIVPVLLVPICNGGCGGVDAPAVLVCWRSFLGPEAAVVTFRGGRGRVTGSGGNQGILTGGRSVFPVPWNVDGGASVGRGNAGTGCVSGPRPSRYKGPRLASESFFRAQRLTAAAALWHRSIPESIKQVAAGCRSRIIRALCRWTVTLIEVRRGSWVVRSLFFV